MQRAALAVFALLCGSLSNCANDGESQVIPPIVLGMLETTPAAYDDGQVQIFEVHLPVELPLRRVGNGEVSGGALPPYPRTPFHLAKDTRVTARYTLSNLENVPHVVELLVDPWNEFVRYEPGVVQDDEETTPNLSGIDRFFTLPPLTRIEGIITPDDFVELATDLGTAMAIAQTPPAGDSAFGGPILYNRAFNVQNRSSEPDPVLAPYFPKTIAGIVGFTLGLRTSEPSKVALEVVLDVEAVTDDRVIPMGEGTRRVGRPGTALVPPAPGP